MVAPARVQVFLSSTSDLNDERDAVRDGIDTKHARVYDYRGHRTGGGPIRRRLTRELKRTDLYVGVFSKRYGSILPESDPERSITEWEFDFAYERDLEIHAFANDHKYPPHEIEARQATFLKKARGFDVACVDLFHDTADLQAKVREAYDDFIHDFFQRDYERKGQQIEEGDPKADAPKLKKYLVSAAGALGMVLVAALAFFGLADQQSSTIMIGVLAIATMAGVLLVD